DGDHPAGRGTGVSAESRYGHKRDRGRQGRGTPSADHIRRRVLLPRGGDARVHRQPDRARVSPAMRRGALRRLVLERTLALLELGLRRLARVPGRFRMGGGATFWMVVAFVSVAAAEAPPDSTRRSSRP